MAQASDIFSHLCQNHGDMHQNHGHLHQNHGHLRQNHGDLHRNHGSRRQNHGDMHRNHGDLRQNQETCTALLATSAVTLPHLRRSSSNEWYFSATPAPSLRRTGTFTLPHQHSYFATPAPSLRHASTVTLPHTFRHISSCEAWRDSIRYCHRGKEPYLGFCRFVH